MAKFSRAGLSGWIVSACLIGMPAAQGAEIRPMLKIGYDFGGDALVTALFYTGEMRTIYANDGLFIGGGVLIRDDSGALETEISLSYKFQTITAGNGDITWDSMPLDAIVFYRVGGGRIGAGGTYRLNPSLSGTGVATGLNIEFNNALGGVLQADYSFTDSMHLGLRYTATTYDAVGGGSVKGNGVGIVFSASF